MGSANRVQFLATVFSTFVNGERNNQDDVNSVAARNVMRNKHNILRY